MAKALKAAWESIRKGGRGVGEVCSDGCYKKLDEEGYRGIGLQKGILNSPVVSALIRLGIQQFSYDPCKIFFMVRVTSCSLVLYYLL